MAATPWQLGHGSSYAMAFLPKLFQEVAQMSTTTMKTRKTLKNPTSKSVWSNCISAKERGPTVTAKDALYLLAHGTTFHLKQCSVKHSRIYL